MKINVLHQLVVRDDNSQRKTLTFKNNPHIVSSELGSSLIRQGLATRDRKELLEQAAELEAAELLKEAVRQQEQQEEGQVQDDASASK